MPLKMSGNRTGLKMSDKAANVQRKQRKQARRIIAAMRLGSRCLKSHTYVGTTMSQLLVFK